MSTNGMISVPDPVLPSASLRIVLLSWPGAGKSTLLAAIAQSQHVNRGRLPEACFVDCPGHPVAQLLTQQTTPETVKIDGCLPSLVQRADSLVVLLDASADPTDTDEKLAELGRFLQAVERERGRRLGIGGLPVFIVLSKTDLLATPADTNDGWKERVEARLRHVQTHFQDFLVQYQARSSVPFGGLDLHFRATAAPCSSLSESLRNNPAPYESSALLREAFERASEFRERQTRSALRLFGTMLGAFGAITAMITLIAFLFLQRQLEEPSIRALLAKIDSYRARASRLASLRLREPLQPKIDELTGIKDDPLFPALPEEKRSYVVAQLEELQDYQVYKGRVERVPPLVAVRSEPELKEIEGALQDVVVPEQRQSSWGQTEAVLRRAERVEEAKAFRRAVDQLSEWYRALVDNSQDLWPRPQQRDGSAIAWPQWHERVRRVVREAETPPHRPTERLPSSALTYEIVFRLDRVALAREAWETLKRSLERVQNLTLALGLAGAGETPLDVPQGFTATQAAERLQELEKRYRDLREQFNLTGLPDGIVEDLRRAVLPRYEHLLQAGREVVLYHLQELREGGPETYEAWNKLRTWLTNPQELQSWRTLAALLARLCSADVEDPVSALASFLAREEFDLNITRFVLEIPDTLGVRPAGKFVIYHRSANEAKPPYAYEATLEKRQDEKREVGVYSLRALGDARLVYRPGDVLWAELPVQSATNAELTLTWARNRSQVYQFERLGRTPRLHRSGQDHTEGSVAEEVLLHVVPEDGLPKIPDLMPIVPFKAENH